LSQYWKPCTNVIDRMPPPTTLPMTMAPTTTTPTHRGTPSRMFSVSPAPWNCGTMYRPHTRATTSIATRRTRTEPSRNSAKSGTV
jgi:hypothetical protein